MLNCPTCKTGMEISELHCEQCNLNLKGQFSLPRLARLSPENIKLAESFLMLGGNLKLLAEQMDISYPTLRRHVDGMIAELKQLQNNDKKRIEEILIKIEQGKISAQEGLRLIREMESSK